MKKITAFVFIAFLGLMTITAQGNGIQSTAIPEGDIPVDPDVIIGTLPNGLTYYIRNNGKPEDKVELRLVVN
ncbi:hypothetical protein, partial [Muriicola sp.]|uniref:hypothetical protein n=1 Tax=Muriicola sp. TaxID=2020856 RepID=UPI003561EC61